MPNRSGNQSQIRKSRNRCLGRIGKPPQKPRANWGVRNSMLPRMTQTGLKLRAKWGCAQPGRGGGSPKRLRHTHATGPPGGPPELFTRMCMVSIPDTASRTALKSSRSSARASCPSPCISVTSESRSTTERAHAITRAPARASIRAQARPMPFEAPQTSAVCPSNMPSAKGNPSLSSPSFIISPNPHNERMSGRAVSDRRP